MPTSKTAFEIITEYCQTHEKNSCIRDLAFSIYQQQYESLINETNDKNSNDAIRKTLLSNGNLLAHVRTAEDMLIKQFEADLKPIQARAAKDVFWMSVVSGIVGNILYSLLLIIVFVIAKDQISSWLSSLATSAK